MSMHALAVAAQAPDRRRHPDGKKLNVQNHHQSTFQTVPKAFNGNARAPLTAFAQSKNHPWR
jgi:hypothetical protein